MIAVDRSTERRNARLQYVVMALVGSVLLYLAVGDASVFAALIVPLLLTVLYRAWNVERLSPHLAQYYGHAVVAGAADRILRELGTNRWLHDAWADAGASTARLFALPPGQITAGMAALAAAGPPERSLTASVRTINRATAVVLGSVLGGALAWTAVLPPLPVFAGLVLLVVFRVVVAFYNRQRIAAVVAAMRMNTRAELTALLDPPWADRRVAVVRELDRLLDRAPAPRRMRELTLIEVLLAGGVVVGAIIGFTAGTVR